MAVADSPVMKQYQAVKAQYPDAVVMFRMGDFYEMFGPDALQASEILGITLTKRRTAQAGDEGVPMCGVPYHAGEGYIGKLLKHGVKVALAEQVESPEAAKKARGSAAIVRREVVRLYTPGTLTEEAYLVDKTPSYLVTVCDDRGAAKGGETLQNAAVERQKGGNGAAAGGGTLQSAAARWEGVVAWLDVSTGEVGWRSVTGASLPQVLAALPVGETVVPGTLEDTVCAWLPRRQVSVHDGLFARSSAESALARAYGVQEVGGLGLTSPHAVQAVGALVGYAELTQMGKLPRLMNPREVSGRARLAMDVSTRRNLELTESLSGRRADSLLGVLDRTVTSAGGRLLGRWVAEPLANVGEIKARQNAVGVLGQGDRVSGSQDLRGRVRELLKDTGDVARCVSRLLLGRGGPRDLAVLRGTGAVLPELAKVLQGCEGLLAEQAVGLNGLGELTALLERALADDPLPALVRDGGFIREGFDGELDGYRKLSTDGNALLAALEEKEARGCGMGAKLRFNQVWGYYLEVTKVQMGGGKTPDHWVHRQTTTQTHRYTTPELMVLERELGSAGAKVQRREEELLAELLEAVKAASYALLAASEALAVLDVVATLAEVAVRLGWICPLVDDSEAFAVEGGKHPVVAARVSDFVANGCDLSGGQLWLLTGPNMAGKSTFLRQNALILILAQMGSFVPAVKAHVGVADAVFSRIGAADDLAAGQSTFMVEMVETAAILNRATSRSLVILDELGRGTATYDGLAIAWACVEDVAGRIGCRTLFATHYHELTALQATLERVSCWQVAVREWKGEIVFLHEVKPGAAAGSYGVQVAKLAGVPQGVVARAQGLLDGFLKVAHGRGVARVDELSLFAAPVRAAAREENEIEKRLKGMDVDGLSAREALEELYRLRGMVN
ncbi:MAG: DNA mismatch repair protein MutS [Proteobacteria bacterium]|nr:DNA mismatch repair protein MutS [Pseudomonadota bacterium]